MRGKAITACFATEPLARERTRLLDRAKGLLEQSGRVDVGEGLTFKQNVLDFLNRMGLAGNPVYVEVQRTDFYPPLPALFEKNFYEGVAFIKSRLELAPDLLKSADLIRPRLGRRDGLVYPSADTNSGGRAKTVARLYRELKQIPPKLDDAEYEKLKAAHPEFLTFYIAEKWPAEAKPFLMRQPNRRKQGLQTAKQLAAIYHSRQLGTIEDDWSRNKPRSRRS